MKQVMSVCSFLFGSWFMAACGGSEAATASAEGGSQRQTVSASGDCRFETCGSVPSSLVKAPKLECASSSSQGCSWSETPDSGSVSFRQCADAECPPKPAVDCPTDTIQSSQYCGSENGAACAWTTVCVPPRVTKPCADANGCAGQPQPALGVICKDGSTGGMACVTDGAACFLERDCD
jgi:hypothetical protein